MPSPDAPSVLFAVWGQPDITVAAALCRALDTDIAAFDEACGQLAAMLPHGLSALHACDVVRFAEKHSGALGSARFITERLVNATVQALAISKP